MAGIGARDFQPVDSEDAQPRSADVPQILILACEGAYESADDADKAVADLVAAFKGTSTLFAEALRTGLLGMLRAPFGMVPPASAEHVSPGQVLRLMRDRRLLGESDPLLTDGRHMPFRGSAVERRWMEVDDEGVETERTVAFRRVHPEVLVVVLAPWPDDEAPVDSRNLDPSLPYVVAVPTALGPSRGASAVVKALGKILGLAEEGTDPEQLCALDLHARAYPNLWVPADPKTEVCPWTRLFEEDAEATVAEHNAFVARPGGLGISGPIWKIEHDELPDGVWQLDAWVPNEACLMKLPLGAPLPTQAEVDSREDADAPKPQRVFCRVCQEHLHARLFGVKPALTDPNSEPPWPEPPVYAKPLMMEPLCTRTEDGWGGATVLVDGLVEVALWSGVTVSLDDTAPTLPDVPDETEDSPEKVERHTLEATWDGVTATLSLMAFPSPSGPTLWMGFEVRRTKAVDEPSEVRWTFDKACWADDDGATEVIRVQPDRLETHLETLRVDPRPEVVAGLEWPWQATEEDTSAGAAVRLQQPGKEETVYGLSMDWLDWALNGGQQADLRVLCDLFWWSADPDDPTQEPVTPGEDDARDLYAGATAASLGVGASERAPGISTLSPIGIEPTGRSLVIRLPKDVGHWGAVTTWSAAASGRRQRVRRILDGVPLGPGTLLPLPEVGTAPVAPEEVVLG